MKKAIELDSLSTRFQSFAGRMYIWTLHYDEAVAEFPMVTRITATDLLIWLRSAPQHEHFHVQRSANPMNVSVFLNVKE